MPPRAKSSTGNGHAPKAPPVAEWGATRPSVALIHALGLWGAWLPLDRQDDAATLFALEATKSLAERLLYPIADEALPRLFPAGAGRLRALVALDRSEPPGGDEPSEIKRREEWVAAREAEKAVARLELRCAFVDDLMRHGRWGLDDAGRARGKLGPLLGSARRTSRRISARRFSPHLAKCSPRLVPRVPGGRSLVLPSARELENDPNRDRRAGKGRAQARNPAPQRPA